MALGDLKFKGILFGNDLWGYVVHEEMPYINPDYKIEMKRYLIIPSRDLIDAHPEILKKDRDFRAASEAARGGGGPKP